MKRVAVFKITDAEGVNKLMAEFPPENVACLNEAIVINYDDQTYPNSYKAEELRGLMLSNEKQLMTTNISMEVALRDIPELDKTIEEVQTKIADIKSTIVKGKNKKEEYDLNKDKNAKIAAYEKELEMYQQRRTNVNETISGFKKSVKNFENKNTVLLEELNKIGYTRNGVLGNVVAGKKA